MNATVAITITAGFIALMGAIGWHAADIPIPSRELTLYNDCQPLVINQLRAPTTAKMNSWKDATFYNRSDGGIEIDGTVDAQNGFGAMIRSGYYCLAYPSADGHLVITDSDVVSR